MHPVLFDFNGTLYNDKRFHRAAWQRYMKQRFGRDYTSEEIEAQFIGPSNYYLFTELLDLHLSPEEAEVCSQEKEAAYREVAREKPENLKLVEGVPDLFDELTRLGVPFALATASVPDNVTFYLEELGLKKWVGRDRIVYEDGSSRPSKPNPAYYLEAARRIGKDVSDCAIVEDSSAGIEAARRAGPWKLIAIDTMIDRARLLAMPGVDEVIHDYRNFLPLLEG